MRGGVPRWVNDYTHIPFTEQGRGHGGCDCWGLVRLVLFEQAGVEVPSYTECYQASTDGGVLSPLIEKERADWPCVEAGDERCFDVALMKSYYGLGQKAVAGDYHVGIVVAPGIVLQCEVGKGTTLGRYLRDIRLSNRLRGFYRPAELAGAA